MHDRGSEVTPVDMQQVAAWRAGRLAEPVQVAPDVWSVAIPIPQGTIPFTLCYLLCDGDAVHLVDPGWDHPESTAALERALQAIGRSLEAVRTVVATHYHPDHMGAANWLRRRTGATRIFSAVEAAVLTQEVAATRDDSLKYRETLDGWGVPAIRREALVQSFARSVDVQRAVADLSAVDGQQLVLGSHALTVLMTPGHTGGHICLVDEERGVLYTGDHVLPNIYPAIGIGTLPGADPFGDYFDALDRLGTYDSYTVLPGHEYCFTGLASRRTTIIAHHLRRTAEVGALMPELGDATVWEYASRLRWSKGWPEMTGLWLHSALLQTSLHRDYFVSGRADRRLAAAGYDMSARTRGDRQVQ